MKNRKQTIAEEELHTIATGVFAETRYVWIFRCSTRLALHAATLDRRARNLPKGLCQGGAWTVNGQLVVGPDTRAGVGFDINALRAGIEREGYYLWNADMEPAPNPLRLMR